MLSAATQSVVVTAQEHRLFVKAVSSLERSARRLRDRWCERRGAASLASLDDRTLADIGYHRSSIGVVVLGFSDADRTGGEAARSVAASLERP